MNTFFITGVDTNIGKTFTSIGIALAQESKGKNIAYFKPFQSGAYEENGSLVAPDVYELKKFSNNITTKYSYLFKGEISPHLASVLENTDVDLNKVKSDLEEIKKDHDFIVIEGAGGYYCPATKGKLFSDVIKFLDEEVIIVTTPDLGRINHTLMTLKLAQIEGIKVKGLIINNMPKNKTLSQEYFIEELKMFSDIEILGIIPKINNPTKENLIEIYNKIILE